MSKSAWFRLLFVTVPYGAVFAGLYALNNAWAAILLYHAGIIVILILGGRKGLLKDVWGRWDSVTAVIAVILCALSGPAILVCWEYIRLEQTEPGVVLGSLGLSGWSFYLFAVYFGTVHPLLEELYWRGFIESDLKYSSWTDFAFAGYHILVLVWFIKLPWVLVSFAVLSVSAWVWRRLFMKFGGIVIPFLSHMAADISIITVTLILSR